MRPLAWSFAECACLDWNQEPLPSQFKDRTRSEASTLLRSPVTVSLMLSLCGGVAVSSAVNDHLLRRDLAAGRSWRDRDPHGVPEGGVNRLADRVGSRADRDDRALAGDVGG